MKRDALREYDDILSSAMAESPFTRNVRAVIRSIPRGRVATYAQVAALAGNPRAVRGVVWVLHCSPEASDLPWHRVINSRGTISLRRGRGFEEQRRRLVGEGVRVSAGGKIDLTRFGWEQQKKRSAAFSRAAARFLKELNVRTRSSRMERAGRMRP
jgi:methylated-DNA-protein-cysteine methyltransferase-like protein